MTKVADPIQQEAIWPPLEGIVRWLPLNDYTVIFMSGVKPRMENMFLGTISMTPYHLQILRSGLLSVLPQKKSRRSYHAINCNHITSQFT